MPKYGREGQFYEALREVFPELSVYVESRKAGTVSFQTNDNGITYAQLVRASEILGTDKIDFTGRETSGTADSFWTEEPEVTAEGVKFPPKRNP